MLTCKNFYSFFQEFLENPKLFSSGHSRFDIGQGSAGTCWFLSTVANIAGNKKMIEQAKIIILYHRSTPAVVSTLLLCIFLRKKYLTNLKPNLN